MLPRRGLESRKETPKQGAGRQVMPHWSNFLLRHRCKRFPSSNTGGGFRYPASQEQPGAGRIHVAQRAQFLPRPSALLPRVRPLGARLFSAS